MAQYILGTGTSTQADAWASLKSALNNYTTQLTLTYDDETYIAKAEFKDMDYYLTFKAYPNSNRLYIEITLYDSEDTQIIQYQANAYSVSVLYLNVFEAQGDSLIFGTIDTQGTNTAAVALIDDTTPIMVVAGTSSQSCKVAIDDHAFDLQLGGVAPYGASDSVIQMVKLYDTITAEFIDGLYETIISKNPSKNYDIMLTTIGQRKFYVFIPAQKSTSNRLLAIECTDKY